MALRVAEGNHPSVILHEEIQYRSQKFRIGGPMLHVMPLFMLEPLIVMVVRVGDGAPMPGPGIFLQWVSTTLLWPIADLLLLAPQRRAARRDENRPL